MSEKGRPRHQVELGLSEDPKIILNVSHSEELLRAVGLLKSGERLEEVMADDSRARAIQMRFSLTSSAIYPDDINIILSFAELKKIFTTQGYLKEAVNRVLAPDKHHHNKILRINSHGL